MLKIWIAESRKIYISVCNKGLVCYVGNTNATFKEKSFKVKLRWVYRFLKRHGFSLSRISHHGQFIQKFHTEIKFITELIEKRKNEL